MADENLLPSAASPSRPSCASRRLVNNWLAERPFRRADPDTGSPLALSYDPLLLRQRSAPPRTCRNHLKPRNRRNRRSSVIRLSVHRQDPHKQGGARRSDTTTPDGQTGAPPSAFGNAHPLIPICASNCLATMRVAPLARRTVATLAANAPPPPASTHFRRRAKFPDSRL